MWWLVVLDVVGAAVVVMVVGSVGQGWRWWVGLVGHMVQGKKATA